MYTSNDSYAYGLGRNNYWHEDRWRFDGVFGHANLKLELRRPGAMSTVAFAGAG